MMILGASLLLGVTVVLFVLVAVDLQAWMVAIVISLAGVLSTGIMTAIILRSFRRRTTRYVPLFPGYGSGQ
jgi:hypothetical protein